MQTKSKTAMARKPREKSSTGIYHVMVRGINRQNIFECEEDFWYFKKILYQMVHPIDIVTNMPISPRCVIYAYCLMPNHVHLLIRQTEESLGAVVRRITGSYAQFYNLKYTRFGHLFQDRYRSEPVNDEAYFFTLLRYIHQNPVAAGMTKTVSDYPWSSWSEYKIGRVQIDGICKTEHVLHRMALDDFSELVNTMLPNAQSILDYDSGNLSRSDDEVRDFLKTKFKIRTPEDLMLYSKERRKDILAQVKAFGASYRQLSRMTGISISIIRSA